MDWQGNGDAPRDVREKIKIVVSQNLVPAVLQVDAMAIDRAADLENPAICNRRDDGRLEIQFPVRRQQPDRLIVGDAAAGERCRIEPLLWVAVTGGRQRDS